MAIADGDASFDTDMELPAGADLFLKHFGQEDSSKKKTSESEVEDDTKQQAAETETEEETSEETLEETTEEQDEGKEDKKSAKLYVEDENAFVKVTVNGEEQEFDIKGLKRLAGQEAALTQRSQQVADQRKAVEAEQTKAANLLGVMLTRARERAKPFQDFNFLAAAKEMSQEELNFVAAQAKQAFDEVKFYETEASTFMKGLQDQQAKAVEAAAEKAVEALTDPADPNYIEGWNEDLYGQLQQYAVNNGIAQQVVENLTDAPVMKLLYKAMLFDKGASKIITTKKTDKQPKKIVKTTKAPGPTSQSEDKIKSAAKKLRESGTQDAAAELFLARHMASVSDNE